MNNWTSRQISGALLTSIGVTSLLIQPAVTGLFRGGSLFLAGLSQAGLSAIGLGCTLIGLYRLGTKDKQPLPIGSSPSSFGSTIHANPRSRKTWIAVGFVGLAAILIIYKTSLDQSRYANLDMTPPLIERQWQQVDSNGNGDALFIDTKSLIRKGDRVEYWDKVTFSVPRNVGSYLGAYAILDRSVIKCSNRTIANVQSSSISQTGQAFNIAYTPKNQQVFVPIANSAGHPDAILFQHVCFTDKR